MVAGYPQNGGLDLRAATVATRMDVTGLDIYDESTVNVYQLRGTLRPGNSGGPLLTTGGQVYGMVFARSVTQPGTGTPWPPMNYALAAQGARADRPVGRGPCPRSRRTASAEGGEFPPRMFFFPDDFLLFSCPCPRVRVGIEYFSPMDHALSIPVRGH